MQDDIDVTQKEHEMKEITKARSLIAKNEKQSLGKAGDILYRLLRDVYGEKCTRHWAFSHYIKLSETAPTYLSKTLEEYLLKTREIQ